MSQSSNGFAVRGAALDQVQPFAFDRGRSVAAPRLHRRSQRDAPIGRLSSRARLYVRGVRYAGMAPRRRIWRAPHGVIGSFGGRGRGELRGRCAQVWSIGCHWRLISLQLAEHQL